MPDRDVLDRIGRRTYAVGGGYGSATYLLYVGWSGEQLRTFCHPYFRWCGVDSTANGISRLTVQRTANDTLYTFVNFNSFDGVIANEFCERSVFEASDGTLYWGGIDGFNRLNPSSVVEEPTTYFPLFVGFSLFGERIESGKAYHGNVILERPMTVTRDIVLEHDQNFFTIEFSAMNYANPTQTYYRYQLEGIDKAEREIHSADGKGYATYTDLPSGDYVFKVRAAGNDKTWTEHYAQLHILVKTPFGVPDMLLRSMCFCWQEVSVCC